MRRFIAVIVVVAVLLPRLLFGAPVPPEIKTVVAFVFAPGPKADQLKPWGTGFFVGVKDPKDENKSFVYLVTAKHVLQTEDRKSWLSKIFLRLNTRTGDSGIIEIPIVPSGKNQTVFLHPNDSTADVAVIPGLPDQKRFDFKLLPMELLTSKQDFADLKIVEGSEVFFTGLFSPHVGTRRNYPVIRFGRVAMITDEKVKFGDYEADLYLVETGSYGGNSGAPLFFYLGSDREPGALILGPPILKLAGVMSGTFLDAQPVRAVETARIAVAPSNMGIAAVVPAYKVLEILSGPEVTARR
ncbi:MAG: hypothetical protein HYU46_24200, partial [Deltaproteobacteria bacterium]|nr:hypothetical protein [Deltaproteobacteria bacterium]